VALKSSRRIFVRGAASFQTPASGSALNQPTG
jgi:hypothetical protein